MNIERNYLIILFNESIFIDFNQVCETSVDTMRKSIDGTKTFVKWKKNESEPDFINNFSFVEGPYNHIEMITVLSGEDWQEINEEI